MRFCDRHHLANLLIFRYRSFSCFSFAPRRSKSTGSRSPFLSAFHVYNLAIYNPQFRPTSQRSRLWHEKCYTY